MRASCLCKSKSLRYYRLEGILCAPTGVREDRRCGIVDRQTQVNTLVVVHPNNCSISGRAPWDFWISGEIIGHIGGGKTERTGCEDVAVIQSLYRKDEVKDFEAEYGQVVVDECRRVLRVRFRTGYAAGDSARRCRFRKSQQKRASDLDSKYVWLPKLEATGGG